MFTEFLDMSSGGSQKLSHGRIIIEAPEAEAVSVFYSRFGRNPRRVSCTCCGEDYFITEIEKIEPDKHFDGKGTAVIPADLIKPEERTVEVPVEGYVWQ